MLKKIIVYSFDNSEINSNEIIKYLCEMKGDLHKQDLPMNRVDFINGNSKFPEIKLFIEQFFQENDDKNTISCDEIKKKIDSIATPFLDFCITTREKEYLNQNKEEPLKNKIEKEHKKRFLSISKNEIGQFWKVSEEYNFPNSFDDDNFFYNVARDKFYNAVNGDILIIVDRNFKRIVGENVVPGAHGVRMISERGNGMVLCIKGYKKIIWHETAHLLGATDHYNPNSDSHETTQDCLNPDDCVMQWNPGDTFCEKCIEEIRNYLG